MTAPTKPPRPEGRRWLQMGIELEGAWDGDYRSIAKATIGAVGKTDGSIRGLPGNMGEITTRPHETLDGLIKDVLTLHPQYVNETTGFHIHTSFTPMDTSLLTTQEFWRFFRGRWEAWGKLNEPGMNKLEKSWFWDRLYAKTTNAQKYCKDDFIPGDQLENHEKRYTQLNFTAYHKFKTVECRFLPMWQTQEMTIGSIKELSDIYDTFLNTFVMPPVKLEKLITGGEELLERENMKTPEHEHWEEHTALKAPALVVGEGIQYHIAGAMDLMLPYSSERILAP